mgnify:CR=1 FL=1
MAKTMAVFDMYMSICVHVRSRFTAPLNSGCEVSKQKQKIVFGMDSLGWISSWRKSEQKNRKIKYTRARACRFTERETESETDQPTDRKTAALTGSPGLAGVLRAY